MIVVSYFIEQFLIRDLTPSFFRDCECDLISNFKIEFGKDVNGNIILADEISPDSCRLWNSDGQSLDKDLFREDKGDPVKLAAKEAEYKARFANPFVAGSRGFIDDVILPHETRKRICRSLVMLKDKKLENPWRKHGNIPL